MQQARSQDFEGEVSAGGAHAHCLTHSDVTQPLQIAMSMKYACIHKISLVCSVAKDVCHRHSTRVLTTEDIVKI